MAREYDVDLHFTHFPLHPDIPAEGLLLAELFAGRGFDFAAMGRQMAARMAAEGLVYKPDRDRTFNTRLAQELALWARARGGPALDIDFFTAVQREGRNVGDTEVLLDIVAKAGLPVEEARAVITERTFSPAVDADWKRARTLGVTGVPTYVAAEPGTGKLRGVVGAQPYEALVRLARMGGAVPTSGHGLPAAPR